MYTNLYSYVSFFSTAFSHFSQAAFHCIDGDGDGGRAHIMFRFAHLFIFLCPNEGKYSEWICARSLGLARCSFSSILFHYISFLFISFLRSMFCVFHNREYILESRVFHCMHTFNTKRLNNFITENCTHQHIAYTHDSLSLSHTISVCVTIFKKRSKVRSWVRTSSNSQWFFCYL